MKSRDKQMEAANRYFRARARALVSTIIFMPLWIVSESILKLEGSLLIIILLFGGLIAFIIGIPLGDKLDKLIGKLGK